MNKIEDLLEKDNYPKNDIILDTSSINTLIKNNNLLDDFFNTTNKKSNNIVIPYAAFSEVSSNDYILNKLSDLYKKNNNLKVSEPVYEKIKREISSSNSTNFYFKKSIDIFYIANECYEKTKQENKRKKEAWKKNCKEIRKKYLKEHNNITPKKLNKDILKMMKSDNLFMEYEKAKDYWVLDFFSNIYEIELPKEEVVFNKNRYGYINLLHYLMLLNLWRSVLSGSSILAPKQGDLFDMEISSLSVYSSCFISEDKALVYLLNRVKSVSNIIGFENKYDVYHKVINFILNSKK